VKKRDTSDRSGRRYGKLVVIKKSDKPGGSGRTSYVCRCDCGAEKEIRSGNLDSGRVKSCGCLRSQVCGDIHRKHGMAKSPEYRVWKGIITRCYNSNATGYEYYGGRGIRVCEEWRRSFDAFYRHMGPRPTPQHSIERSDPNGDYCPQNCRWATPAEQSINKRNTVSVTFRGETRPLAEWGELARINYETLRIRIKVRGWDVERALTTPSRGVGGLQDRGTT
jgi:hypothetical protein